MGYVFLGIAILMEVAATSLLRETAGFTRLVPSLLCGTAYAICHVAFSRAVLHIHLGVSYAIWCGVGILVTSAVSILVYQEKLSPMNYGGLLLILIGILLVNLS